MRILVITSEPRWVNAVRTAFGLEHDVIPAHPRESESWRTFASVVDACFVAETELGSAAVELVKEIAGRFETPVFVAAEGLRAEWEEAALAAGARQAFKFPLRPGVVVPAITRLRRGSATASVASHLLATPGFPPITSPRETGELALLRQFSRLLRLSPADPGFVATYLGLLREILGAGRVILYLRDRHASSGAFKLAGLSGGDSRQFEHFRVYPDQGLGRLVALRGSVVLRHRLRIEDTHDAIAQRELALFGADVAFPLASADGCAGILLLGARIAGGDYSDRELTQMYHLLEDFAATLERSAAETFAAPAGPPASFPSVLHGLPVGCVLLDPSLRILEANEAFRSQLGRATANPLGIERLPAPWTEAIASAIQNRAGLAPLELEHELSGAVRRVRVSLQPVATDALEGGLWLMVTEDITNETRLRQEIHDRSTHNVLQRAGEQLSNEFRNALTPIEILVQLSGDSATARRDVERLRGPVFQAVQRLRRRVDNLSYLTKNSILAETTTVSAVFRAARERLDNWLEPKQLKTLVWSGEFSKVTFTVDSTAVGLALAELVMNAVEAAGGRQVTITADDLPDSVHFKVRNPGEWSPPAEAGGFGHRPFVTAKSAGVGLGVEVASRVAEYHGGRLVLGPVSPDLVEGVLRLPRNLPNPAAMVDSLDTLKRA